MKKQNCWEMKTSRLLGSIIDGIALVIGGLLIIVAAYIGFDAFQQLFINKSPIAAVTDALFVVILLELFYAIRSFVKRGSMNVGVIVNVGVIAAVKELVFQLEFLDLEKAISFGIIFISLGILYVLEVIHYEKKRPD